MIETFFENFHLADLLDWQSETGISCNKTITHVQWGTCYGVALSISGLKVSWYACNMRYSTLLLCLWITVALVQTRWHMF